MMSSRLLIKIALPMIAISLLLLGVGITAAWHVQKQQEESSELIRREVHGLLAVEDLFAAIREIRRELDLYLRSHDPQRLENIETMTPAPQALILLAKESARTEQELELVEVVERGYEHFLGEFRNLRTKRVGEELDQAFGKLGDDVLTNEVLRPARECIVFNRQVVDLMNEAGRVTAQHVRVGFLLLGVTGGLAGLLIGLGMARAVSRSIVQLEFRVRGATGKLNDVVDPVQIVHYGDSRGIEQGLLHLEDQIGRVVRRLQQREIELRRSEQLAVVGQLAAGMAHEMRNPLMPIKILVQSALAREGETLMNRRQLQIVNDELVRLEESIQSFLDFARPPELQLTPIELRPILYQAVDLAFPKALLHEVELHCVVPARRVVVSGDPTQLKQLLLNLLLNAFDALPDGGLVEVWLEAAADEVESSPGAARRRDIGSEQDALRILGQSPLAGRPRCRVHVRDTGPGISAEIRERLFEPFATTKDSGTGLGLATCRQIARAHGGDVTVSNVAPSGARFTIELPQADEIALPAVRAAG